MSQRVGCPPFKVSEQAKAWTPNGEAATHIAKDWGGTSSEMTRKSEVGLAKLTPPICGDLCNDLLIRRWVGRQTTVAQIVNLLYRRLGVGRRRNPPNRVPLGETRRLPTCDTADCQSALLGCHPFGVGHPAESAPRRPFQFWSPAPGKLAVRPLPCWNCWWW